MKKLIAILVCLLITIGVFAQNKLNTGLNIGYSSSTFVGHDIPGKGLASVSSALIGGYFRYGFNPRYAIQPELNFYAKGARINTVDNLYEYVYLGYLEIPVLFEMKFRNEKKLKPIIYAGPAIGINTNASGSRGYLTNVRKMDGSMIAGMGIEIWKLSFQVRYGLGLTRFDKAKTV